MMLQPEGARGNSAARIVVQPPGWAVGQKEKGQILLPQCAMNQNI